MQADLMQTISAAIFGIALLHTFGAKYFESLAHRSTRHAGLFHLLGEVEVGFGFWAFVLVATMALVTGSKEAISYAESRHYTEPLFVFVVMVVAASRPVLEAVRQLLGATARLSTCDVRIQYCSGQRAVTAVSCEVRIQGTGNPVGNRSHQAGQPASGRDLTPTSGPRAGAAGSLPQRRGSCARGARLNCRLRRTRGCAHSGAHGLPIH